MVGHEVVERLRSVPLFAQVDVMVLTDLARSGELRLVHLARGEQLVAVGDAADEAYVVVDGALEASTGATEGGEARLAALPAGSVVGEIAVLNGGRRTASLRATEPTQVVAIAAAIFTALLEREPGLAGEIAAAGRQRLLATRMARQLLALFPGLGVAERNGEAMQVGTLAAEAVPVSLRAGEVLFRRGDPGDAAYLVVSGRLRVLDDGTDDDGTPRVVAEIGAGQLAGELSLLDDAPRGATLVAARDTELARISRTSLEDLVREAPSAMLEITRTIVRRSREPRDVFRRAASDGLTIGVVGITPGLDLHTVVAELATRMRTHGRVQHLSGRDADRVVGEGANAEAVLSGAGRLRLERWLADVEDRADVLLLEADGLTSPWAEHCARQVDHLVLVADATADPAPSPEERRLLVDRELPHQHVSLLLVQPRDLERPAGTSAWLAARDVDDHHHVRDGHRGDVERVARHLAGRAVTLVCSGGGAKGFAHLGVVQALQEVGVPIDAVVGTSMGAPMTAMVAIETPADELVSRVAAFYRGVLDYTIPVTSLVAGRRAARRVEEGAEGRAIEDTWLPFACVSTNLTRSRPVVHRRGDLATALRASIAIPGVLPPVPVDGDLLVDGAVLDNLPLGVARQANPTGTVIASDVAPTLGPRAKEDFGLYVSGTGVLARRLIPGMKAPKVPALMATVMRSLMASAAYARDVGVERGLADLYLLMELRGVGVLEFDRAEEVARMGYEEALESVTAWANSR
jgi:predicted acylesterase/phospholipase RssA/CRP-like cAMP-binding protein